jgi:hypothetical protein
MLVALQVPLRFAPTQRNTDREFAFLQRRFTPRTVYMEIGAADCGLALRAAGYVDRVYALDVSGQFIESVLAPCNLRLMRCDGAARGGLRRLDHLPHRAWLRAQVRDHRGHPHLALRPAAGGRGRIRLCRRIWRCSF